MNSSLIHRVLRKEKTSHVPTWFMRQAGRYLPEYRELRTKAGNFLNLCYNPEMAAEVTLQPIRRFDFDAAIIFSDILVIPHAMGVELRFEQGEGPRLSPTRDYAAAEKLNINVKEYVSRTCEAISKVRSELPAEKSLIGFCGAPWTVACYMVEGGSDRDYEFVRGFALSDEKTFSLIIEKIVNTSISYLSMQVKSGADIVQIFDSWAGLHSENEYEKWVIAPTKKLVEGFKKLHPDVPVIGFPRASGVRYKAYSEATGVDVVGVDAQTPLSWAVDTLQMPLQGNLDPVLLAHDKEAAVAETRRILKTMKGKPFIFNLGHGILQRTPIENVQAVCDAVRMNP